MINLALELSEAERAYVVDELLASLDPEEDADADAAWALELDKRVQEMADGKVEPVSWDVVKEYAARRIVGRD